MKDILCAKGKRVINAQADKNNAPVKVSVIIPVFCMQPYLPACLDSVLEQRGLEIEVLCLCPEREGGAALTLKEYAARDSRVRLVPTEAKNEGEAYGEGLAEALGGRIYEKAKKYMMYIMPNRDKNYRLK